MATYSYSGKPVFETVGTGGTFTVIGYGAQGGAGNSTGGSGAEIIGSFNLTANEHIELIVGGSGGYNSGGGGGTFVLGNGTGDGTGNGTYSTVLLVAGGGGGGGSGGNAAGAAASFSGSPGSGNGGAGGLPSASGFFSNSGGGGGGAGIKTAGSNGANYTANGRYYSGGGGGKNGQNGGGYAGGAGGGSNGGPGGFGGGGGGGTLLYGGGGGGYTGGAGGGYTSTGGGGGGTSIDNGTAILAKDAVATGQNGNGLITISPNVCFASGTLIRTARGDVPVEFLAVGDRAVTVSGDARPIRWLGHRTIDCRRHPRRYEAHPVCIAAHAFGPGRPARDLYVSPGHAICVDVMGEVLIPSTALVDGVGVQQVEVDEVTYWHVELQSHDVLLAENLPCESYLEMGNRGFFREAAVIDLAAGPDVLGTSHRTHADFCRPFHANGPVVEAARARLQALAGAQRALALSATTPAG